MICRANWVWFPCLLAVLSKILRWSEDLCLTQLMQELHIVSPLLLCITLIDLSNWQFSSMGWNVMSCLVDPLLPRWHHCLTMFSRVLPQNPILCGPISIRGTFSDWRVSPDFLCSAFTCWQVMQCFTYSAIYFFISFHQYVCLRLQYIFVLPGCTA